MSEVTLTKKSGKGMNHGVISELSTFFTVKPGHEEQLRQASKRFNMMLLGAPPKVLQQVGIRDMRHVIFDNGRRFLLITAFETDWDAYIDDAITLIGVDKWIDWLQHLAEYPAEGLEKASNAQIKVFLQSAQVPASCYWNGFAAQTTPEIKKALQVEQAFEQVIDDPAGAQAIQQPALKPLLEQAAG